MAESRQRLTTAVRPDPELFQPGWPRCWPSATKGSWRRTSRTSADAPDGCCKTRSPLRRAGARPSGVLRLGGHGRRSRVVGGRDRRAVAGGRGRLRRRGLRERSSRSSAARAARRSRTSGCSRGRFTCASGCSSARARGQGDAISVFERGAAVQRPAVSGRRGRKALGARRDPGRRPDRRASRP